MFVIADNQNKRAPVFLLKVLEHNGWALGTLEMRSTQIYPLEKDAREALAKIKNHGPFTFTVHRLTIE